MRPTALLLSSLALASCGSTQNVDLTGKLVMSTFPADWCGATNPDTIRMDCPFEVGLYILQDAVNDAGPPTVVSNVCVKLPGLAMRDWADLPMALNDNKASLQVLASNQNVRLEMAIVEPPSIVDCDHDSTVAAAKLYGSSQETMIDSPVDDPPLMRIDVTTKCIKAFTPTATCLPTP